MKTRQCANCGSRYPFKDSRCPDCGTHNRQDERKPQSHPNGYPQCTWESNGERCRYPGALSSATEGSGPWYCRHHFSCSDARFGAQVVEASRDYRHATGAELIAEITREAARAGTRVSHIPKRIGAVDKLAWAKKIVERKKAGEEVSMMLEKMAYEALGETA